MLIINSKRLRLFCSVLCFSFICMTTFFSHTTFAKQRHYNDNYEKKSYVGKKGSYNRNRRSNKPISKLTDFSDFEEKYRHAVQLESLKMYTKAQHNYQLLNEFFFDAYPMIKYDRVLLTEIIPIVISSVFRLSETTSRSNYSNMFQLVHQISQPRSFH